MSGGGGLFGSQQAQPMIPQPVQTYPGAQGLVQSLMNYYQNILSGQNARQPYKGYASVYGNQQPTLNLGNEMSFNAGFPTSSAFATAPGSGTGAPSAPSSPGMSASDIQNAVNQAIATALAQPTAYNVGGGGRDAGGGRS